MEICCTSKSLIAIIIIIITNAVGKMAGRKVTAGNKKFWPYW